MLLRGEGDVEMDPLCVSVLLLLCREEHVMAGEDAGFYLHLGLDE